MRLRWMMSALGAVALAWLGLVESGSGQPGKGKKTGEVNTPPAFAERKITRIKVGDPAPDFTLADRLCT